MKLQRTEEKDIKDEEIQENKKISKLVDKKTAKKVFANLIIAVLIMAYFCIISAVYDNVQETGIIKVIKISTMVFLGIALILIEFAFKRESKTLLIHTFESLAIALHSLTTVYITRVFKLDFKGYILVSSYIFSIYYVLKAIVINTKARKEYLNNLSDISDIVKKDEPTKKEAVKKEKKNKKEEQNKIKEVENEIIIENEVDEKNNARIKNKKIQKQEMIKEEPKGKVEENIENTKQSSENEKVEERIPKLKNKKLADIRAKLRELQRQDEEIKQRKENEKKEKENKEIKQKNEEEITIEKIEEPIEQTPKRKRGRPKKDNSIKEEKKETNTESEETVEQAQKGKRGRPKKEVKKDD